MKDQHIKTIREACIKANPEILKLEFGCNTTGGKIAIYEENIKAMMCITTSGDSRIFSADTDLIQILGRDIRLADVLLAMQHTHCDRAGFIDYNGQFWDCDNNMEVFKEVGPYPCWNMKLDRLEDQNEECLKFLTDLLK